MRFLSALLSAAALSVASRAFVAPLWASAAPPVRPQPQPVAPTSTPVRTATPTPTPRPTATPTVTPIPLPTATPAPRPTFAFALPPFDASKTATDVSWLNHTPAGKYGFIKAQGEHFVTANGQQMRFWGVNLNFDGCFPPKDQAPLIAARLAKFGFNAARMHHFDGYGVPRGIWKVDPASKYGSFKPASPREVDTDQLDRFEFFCAELIKHGIYLDVNLHVGRKTLDGEVEDAANLPEKDKGPNTFDPQLAQLQDDFSRMLLTHRNPYLGHALKDEPGVCALEADNESSLLGSWLDQGLKFPPRYAAQLQTKWSEFLRARYPSDARLQYAYQEASEPLTGPNLLSGPLPARYLNPDSVDARDYQSLDALRQANLALVAPALGATQIDSLSGPSPRGFVRPGLSVQTIKQGTVSWAFQLNRDALDLQDNTVYTLEFWARSDLKRRISVNLWQDRAPNRFEGFTGFADVTPNWQKYTFAFRPQNPDPSHSRVSWNLGNGVGTIQFGEISLFRGGRIAAPLEWTTTTTPLLDFKTTPITRARRDFAEFLQGLEVESAARTRTFLRGLGVKCPIWQTQAQFGGWAGLMREQKSDAQDFHAYWKHPDFGGAGWSGTAWKIDQSSMTSAPGIDPLTGFGFGRLAGQPFTMTEWNSGQPNDYGAESLLMVSAYAAWHDWSGVWIFDYHSGGPYDRNSYEGFFSIDAHPTKMATAPAAALLFRRPDLATATDITTLNLPPEFAWDDLANSPGQPTALPYIKTWRNAGGARDLTMSGDVRVNFGKGTFPSARRAGSNAAAPNAWQSDTNEVGWNGTAGLFTADSPLSKVAIGSLGGKVLNLGTLRLSAPVEGNNFAALALSSMDSQPLTASGKMLLTVAGRAENLNMGWNAQHNSVGNTWGTGPTQVEGITCRVTLLTDRTDLNVWALDTTGARKALVPATLQNGVLQFRASPTFQTVWYEIAAQ